MSKSMTDSGCTEQESTGTDLRSVGDYAFTQEGRTYVWEHTETGLTVELSKVAGQRDGYGNIDKGYQGLARPARGKPAIDVICGHGRAAYLPSKAEAWELVQKWMQNRPDGELLGNEECEY